MKEAVTGVRQDALIEYLARQVIFSPAYRYQPAWLDAATAISDSQRVQNLAASFLGDAEFQALKLGTFLTTPDGQVLLEAIEMAIPGTSAGEVQLLAAALELAAGWQQNGLRTQAEGLAFGVVIIALVSLVLISMRKPRV